MAQGSKIFLNEMVQDTNESDLQSMIMMDAIVEQASYAAASRSIYLLVKCEPCPRDINGFFLCPSGEVSSFRTMFNDRTLNEYVGWKVQVYLKGDIEDKNIYGLSVMNSQ